MDQPGAIAEAFDASAPRFELRCWGVFRLIDRTTGADRAPRGRKARALLAWLALLHEPVTRERAAALLWGDRGEAQARSSLRQAVHELRALSDAPLVLSGREHIQADPAVIETEIGLLDRIAVGGDLAMLTDALMHAPGPAFPDLDGVSPDFDDWLRIERVAVGERRLEIGLAAGESGLERGEAAAVLGLVRILETIDPASERVARLGMRAELASGDRVGAQRRYARLQEALARELGVEPGEETERLHRLAKSPARSADGKPHTLGTGDDAAPLPAVSAKRPWFRRPLWLAAALLVLAAIAGLAVWHLARSNAAAEPPGIAVLPFRNLAPGDDYFAEGVAEEILSQLAGTPGLRVAGRTSSWMFGDDGRDVREIGRRLDVDYVLEGSVRRDGDRVRVDVTLVDAANGMRLWSHPFEGRLDDILSIQDQIGRDIRERLRIQLAQTGRRRETSGEVYATWLIARGLIRTRDPGNMRQAIELLRRVVRDDPSFAPGWSSLGAALWIYRWSDNNQGEEALRHARRAIELDPNLAEANAALGMMLGDTDQAQSLHYLQRAVELDPANAEAWYWLFSALANGHDFGGSLAALRRAVALDPFWVRMTVYPDVAWEMGYREESMRFERRIIADHPSAAQREMARARVAARQGDWSGYIMHNRRAVRLDIGNEVRSEADFNARMAMLKLGFPFDPPVDNAVTRLWARVLRGDVPVRGYMPGLIEGPNDFWQVTGLNYNISRFLINHGRGAELVALYDGAFGSPEGMTAYYDLIYFAPDVAIALRGVGRSAEAGHLLAIADSRIRGIIARGRAPVGFYVAVARVWATMGRREQAAALLERAAAAGWPWSGDIGDSDRWVPRIVLAEDPGFQAIRDDPRLRRIDAMIEANRVRERREVEAMLVAG